MSILDTQEDPELTPSQLELVSALTEGDVHEIDQLILKATGDKYRKVSFVVGSVMGELRKSVPDVYIAQRVAELVSLGILEALGDAKHIRYCEVKCSYSMNHPHKHEQPNRQ